MTSVLHVEPIPASDLDRVRRSGLDDDGNPVSPFVVDSDGAPLRCCLREARAGERLALIAYRPSGGLGAYAELGPVFVHASACAGYPEVSTPPAEFSGRQQVLRAYDATGRIADAVLVAGTDVAAGCATLFANPDTVVVHARNVLFGCYLYAVRRPR